MDETKVQIGEDVILDIGTHSDWYISGISYDGVSVNVGLRRKADRYKEWWLADTPQTDRMTEEEFDTMLAKALVGQTDCDKCIWNVCNYNKVEWDTDTPQTESEVTRNSLRTDCTGCKFVG